MRFDVWSHHPYTLGGPQHQAENPDDVSVGDLPDVKRLLDRAYALGALPAKPRFWITEFSWDTNPPDAGGVPVELHARWVAEVLYRMWKLGISQVTWFQLRDKPISQAPGGNWQSGLYFLDGRAKPALQAFRFPFVAFRSGKKRVSVWGRTPGSDRRKVRIEQQGRKKRWRLLKVVRSDRNGIFTARPKRRGKRPVRARLVKVGTGSRPFALGRTPDIPTGLFGTNTPSG